MLDAIIIGLLTSISVGGLGLAVFKRKISKESLLKSRLNLIADNTKLKRDITSEENARNRKRAVERGLREIEEKRSTAKRKGYKQRLLQRMREAGLNWSYRKLAEINVTVGCCVALILLNAGISVIGSLILGSVFGWAAPQMYILKAKKKRLTVFERQLPNAIDIVSRGLQAGLPLSECIKIVSTQSEDPLKSEFVFLVQDLTLGLTMEEATLRLAQRLPISEVNFFATILASQSKVGGSLSEALNNLSAVLRDRRNMKEKIKAASSEVVTSSLIIGFMPFLVSGLVYYLNPEYLNILFETTAGQVTLTVSITWMLIGIFVIVNMINFDI